MASPERICNSGIRILVVGQRPWRMGIYNVFHLSNYQASWPSQKILLSLPDSIQVLPPLQRLFQLISSFLCLSTLRTTYFSTYCPVLYFFRSWSSSPRGWILTGSNNTKYIKKFISRVQCMFWHWAYKCLLDWTTVNSYPILPTQEWREEGTCPNVLRTLSGHWSSQETGTPDLQFCSIKHILRGAALSP